MAATCCSTRAVLMEPFSWTALKRTLRRGEIAIEDISRFIGLTSTASLEPDPIPLKVKVVLFGDRLLYFLLAAYDPELGEHFKVLADFENDLARTPETEAILARLVAGIAGRNGLRPFDRDAVALVLESTRPGSPTTPASSPRGRAAARGPDRGRLLRPRCRARGRRAQRRRARSRRVSGAPPVSATGRSR